MLIAAVALAFAIELAAVGWQRSGLRRIGKQPLDAIMFIVAVLGMNKLALAVASFGAGPLIAAAAAHMAAFLPHFPLGWAALPVYLIAVDFGLYWSHRAFHSRWLWPVHRFHHDATVLTPLTVFRNHPANWLFDPLVTLLPVALLAPSAAMMQVYAFISILHTALLHSEIRTGYGPFGRFVISPLAHRLHHSQEPRYRDKNFASFLPIWDHLFGTYELASP